jgi:DNA-binding GntR family transcriptional regulator
VKISKTTERQADQAYRNIEELILTAELPPGAWIAETAIAERIGLGRTPVREAVQRLAFHRLIEVVPGRGVRVMDINVRDQLLIVELRREIEILLVRRAAKLRTTDETRKFLALSDAFRIQVPTDASSFYKIDLEFKLQLLRSARNHYASDAIAPLWSASRRFARVFQTAQDIALSADILRRTTAAIGTGDEAAAIVATEERMAYLERFARATIGLYD